MGVHGLGWRQINVEEVKRTRVRVLICSFFSAVLFIVAVPFLYFFAKLLFSNYICWQLGKDPIFSLSFTLFGFILFVAPSFGAFVFGRRAFKLRGKKNVLKKAPLCTLWFGQMRECSIGIMCCLSCFKAWFNLNRGVFWKKLFFFWDKNIWNRPAYVRGGMANITFSQRRPLWKRVRSFFSCSWGILQPEMRRRR